MRQSSAVKTWIRGSAVVVLLLLSAVRIFGATITVTSTADSGPGSLRAAIASAANGDTINFSLEYPATILLHTPLTLGQSVTITGPVNNLLAISGGDRVGVFIVNAGATVAISGLVIEHGSSLLGGGIFNGGTLTLTEVNVTSNTQGTQLGGGIFNSGTLTMWISFVEDNSTGFGVALVSGETGLGGGIYNYGEAGGGTLWLINSAVSGNVANQGLAGYPSGGGIYNDQGRVTLTDSLVTNNTLNSTTPNYVGSGGGIRNDGGTLSVMNSTISGNSADFGGGIYANSGTVTVTNSTFVGNVAGDDGGAIYSVYPDTLNVAFSTFANNAAGVEGGGIDAGGLTLKNSILASNGAGTYSTGNCASDSPFSTSTSDGHNFSDDNSCYEVLTGPGDFSNIPPGLDPSGLEENGGPTPTIALLANSPAVDYIPLSSCTDTSGIPVTTDQRGVYRPQGSGCDVGAYELQTTGSVPASGNECNGIFNGTFQGDITVSNGQSCTFIAGRITGNVTQNGGSLFTRNATIEGNLQITGSSTFSIATTVIGRDFQIQNIPTGAAQNQVCGTSVGRNLQFQNNGTAVQIGSASPPCLGNKVGGNLQVGNNSASTTIFNNTVTGNLQDHSNTAPTQVVGNTVGGNLQVQNNTGTGQVSNNTVTNNLQCQNNTSITGGGKATASKQGQCSF